MMSFTLFKRISYLSFFLVSACSCHESKQSKSNTTAQKTELEQKDTNITVASDKVSLNRTELAQLYSKTIGDFMQLVEQKDQLVFDTLFLSERKLGTEDNFPEFDLPERIGNTSIIMVSTGKSPEKYKSHFKKTSPFINLMGWANKTDAEFIFVTFYPEFKHQYDCYLSYVYEPSKKEFELQEERLEVLNGNPLNSTPHFAIYKQGKHIGDKALK
jgi:hypothetical protein